jgi:glycosyltransferase involved in cell wall biosynthesis
MSLPPWCQSALLGLAGASALFWLNAGFRLYFGSRRLRVLSDVAPLADDALPPVTIVVAAKDEAARVEEAARAWLRIDYPRLEIVIVDDRSTDGTGAILDRAAAQEPRLKVIHVAALPEGWIGKCHALARGAAASSGDWILFSDGDVVLSPDAVRRGISHAIRERADHLAVGIDLDVHGVGEAMFIGYFLAAFFLSQRPWAVPDPRSDAHIGIGAFNLVRRDAYVRAGGHERLRMELLDDLGLGLIVKRSGGRSLFALPGGMVRARWHVGVRGLIQGVEKNAFPAMRFHLGLTVFAVSAQVISSLAPLAGLLAADSWTRGFAILAWSGIFLVYTVTSSFASIRAWQAVMMPMGALLFAFAIARSAAAILTRGGVVWRGTFYRLEELKRGLVR